MRADVGRGQKAGRARGGRAIARYQARAARDPFEAVTCAPTFTPRSHARVFTRRFCALFFAVDKGLLKNAL